MGDPKALVATLGSVLQKLAPTPAIAAQMSAAQTQLVNAIAKAQAITPASTPGEVAAAQAAYTDAKNAWDAARNDVAQGDPTRLLQPVLDIVPLPGLRDLLKSIGEDGIDQQVALGPLTVDLKVPPATALVQMATAGGPPPLPLVFLGYQAPDSVGLDLNLPPMGGGGFLEAQSDPLRLAGAIGLRLGVVDVNAFGIIEKIAGDELSVLVLLGVHFFPGIQLSFGFAIGAVGGLVGINRALDLDVARAKLCDGSVTDALFPDDPVAKAPQLLATLGELFPARDGSFVFGPTFQLNWGQVSPTGPAIAQADLALIIELPGPRRIALVGRLQVNLPPGPVPLVHIELDVIGAVDMVAALLSIDASLVRSGLLAVFRITGDAAFRLSWGSRPYMLLSLGGFHPSFNPEPGVGHALARLGLALDSPIGGVYMRAEGYFAITPNTLQFGGRIEAGIGAAGVEAGGFVALDAIAFFSPFHFAIDFSAGFCVRFEGEDLGSISVGGNIAGPGPIVIAASLSVSILFFDISWDETFTLPPSVDQPVPTVALRQAVQDQLARSANLKGGDIVDPAVRLVAKASRADDPLLALVAPTGTLRWSQSSVPFDTTLMRLDGVDLSDPGAAALVPADPTTLSVQDASREWFSPAGFRKLTSAEAINQPSYAELPSGRVFTLAAKSGGPTPKVPGFVAFVKRPGGPIPLGSNFTRVLHSARLLSSVTGRAGAAACSDLSPAVAIDRGRETAWTMSGGGGQKVVNSETEAFTQVALASSRKPGTPQVAAARIDDRVSLGGVL